MLVTVVIFGYVSLKQIFTFKIISALDLPDQLDSKALQKVLDAMTSALIEKGQVLLKDQEDETLQMKILRDNSKELISSISKALKTTFEQEGGKFFETLS
jgi:hypothetical protein